MRITALILITLCFSVSAVFGADFQPNPLNISGPGMIQYNFDGSTLDIPVDVTGPTSTVVFSVYTSGLASEVSDIQNGFLGWHYINNIDTCVYFSSPEILTDGSHELQWDGTNTDQELVAKGDYTYYLWGFDSTSPKKLVTDVVTYAWVERSQIWTLDENGTPLEKPYILKINRETAAATELSEHVNYKWTIGNDPSDSTRMETTITEDFAYGAGFCLQPDDHSFFFNHTSDNNGTVYVRKFKWVPNGKAEIQDTWGEQGAYTYNSPHTPGWYFFAGVVSDYGDYLFVDNGDFSQAKPVDTEVIVLDVNTGEEMYSLDVSRFWVYEFSDMNGEWATEGPNDMCFQNGYLLLGTMWAQEIGMIDPYGNTENDPHVWFNGQGDGYCDMIKDDNPFGLPGRAYEQKYRSQMDGKLFTSTPAYDLGATSFSLMGPDGTGFGYFSYANETAGTKFGQNYVDSGSAYDGMYTDNASSEADTNGWWYIAQDSFKGVIAFATDVDDEKPGAFMTAQNTPNPFNPTTTISYTIPEAGNVQVAVYNLAGQHVATLSDAPQQAGSHSLTWDASDLAAGVYFCTISAGSQSQTIKMTLLK